MAYPGVQSQPQRPQVQAKSRNNKRKSLIPGELILSNRELLAGFLRSLLSLIKVDC